MQYKNSGVCQQADKRPVRKQFNLRNWKITLQFLKFISVIK